MIKTKIRKDNRGVFVNADGRIARPFNMQTKYQEGDKVKAHTFSQSSIAGVGGEDANFRKWRPEIGNYEVWGTYGIRTTDYDKLKNNSKFKEFEELSIRWYQYERFGGKRFNYMMKLGRELGMNT